MSAPVVTPRALAEVACTLSMTASEVRINCATREEAEEVFDWLEAHVGHRTAAEAAAEARVAKLVEALEQIAEPAMVPLDELPNGWRAVAVERIDIARAILARTKAAADA